MIGFFELKKHCENHPEQHVRILWERFCERGSKAARWCEQINKLERRVEELERQIDDARNAWLEQSEHD